MDQFDYERRRRDVDEEKAESDIVPYHDDIAQDSHNAEKNAAVANQAVLPELSQTVSNALSRVATRMTNRDVVDPGPPPGRCNF